MVRHDGVELSSAADKIARVERIGETVADLLAGNTTIVLALSGVALVAILVFTLVVLRLPSVSRRRRRRRELRQFRHRADVDFERGHGEVASLSVAGTEAEAAGPSGEEFRTTVMPPPEEAIAVDDVPPAVTQSGAATPQYSALTEPTSSDAAPPGYVPLAMPELWEPPEDDYVLRAAQSPLPSAPVPPPPASTLPPTAPPSEPPAPYSATAYPEPSPYVFVARYGTDSGWHANPSTGPTRPAVEIPKSLAELRTGPLQGRHFATMQDFAVAAVVEGGHDIDVVAPLFRLQRWRLEQMIAQRYGAR